MLKELAFLLTLIFFSANAQDVRPPSNLDGPNHLPSIPVCSGIARQVCPIGAVENGVICTRPFQNCPHSYVWEHNRCINQRKLCPHGYEFDGNHCVAPTPICPFNSRWNGVFCKQEVMNCPPGTSFRDNACFSQRTTCPNDMNLHGNACVHPAPLCPPGYQMMGNGFCGEICQETYSCPDGSYWNSSECVRYNRPVLCPDGSYWNGSECVRYYPPVLCPPNYTLKDGICRLTIHDGKCPTNYTLKDGICLPPIKGCPPNYTFKDGICRPPIHVGVCPPNYTLTDGICRLTIHDGKCPPNYTLKDGICLPPIKGCLPNYTLKDGICRPSIKDCPPNYSFRNGSCMPDITVIVCPLNYILINGKCYTRMMLTSTTKPPVLIHCSQNYTLINGKCYPRLDPIVETTSNPNSGINILISPAETIVHNNNTINREVTINNENINNVHVYSDVRCKDGKIRTMIVKNNETISGCPDTDTEVDIDVEDATDEKCCEVVTPRQCHRRNDNRWTCFNRKYNRCGSFCSSGTVYLQPTRPVTFNQQYVPPCNSWNCPPVDCSGCAQGMRQCNAQCSFSTCQTSSCIFVSHESFCGTHGGPGCTQQDGCQTC